MISGTQALEKGDTASILIHQCFSEMEVGPLPYIRQNSL